MILKDLDLAKLSQVTSDYADQLKCLECCKYFIAPATASCGHTLCHTCWRGRRTCPTCACAVDRKTLKLNLPLQTLTDHVQTLGEAFEKLFKTKLDEFSLDTPAINEPEKDPDKNVNDWLTSSQNHFSAPVTNSEPFTQELQQPVNPLELSSSNILIHTNSRKNVSANKSPKVVHVPPPQDDWDKIEPMPDVENVKTNQNIVGPMDIEPFFVDDSEYTTVNPRRSSRKKDVKQDDSKTHDISSKKNVSRDSSCETDKKSHLSKQNWNNVKKMRKEFGKLNKNKNKLNVSIEMVKKTQNIKPVNNTPIFATQQLVSIDDNTPDILNKENKDIVGVRDSYDTNQVPKSSGTNSGVNNQDIITIQSSIENNSKKGSVMHNRNFNKSHTSNVNPKNSMLENVSPQPEKSNRNDLDEEAKMPFIKKSALCPKNIEINCDNSQNDQNVVSGPSEDIEISIKIGNTVTNIVIKKKNDVQVKINTDREVQTSLDTNNLTNCDTVAKEGDLQNIDINIGAVSTRVKTYLAALDKNVSTSEKKNTASADTASAQFEITESVEKELSNVMECKTAQSKADTNSNTVVKDVETNQHMEDNLDDLNDLDIFNSGSVKEANVQLLKEPANSEILKSTVCSKMKSQKNTGKRNRDTGEETLPDNKKRKMPSQNNNTLPDSEPINYDVIMGQVFANIDADMEDIRKSQNTQIISTTTDEMSNQVVSKAPKLPEIQKTQTIKQGTQSNSHTDIQEYFRDRHSENVFSILEKDDENVELTKNTKMHVADLLTPVLCRNLDASQESHDGITKTNKSNKKSQDYDDSDRSVVEETPQKDMSYAKLKRAGISNNMSQIALSETKNIPSRTSLQGMKSIVNLTDSVSEYSKSCGDVTVVNAALKNAALETPLTITKFTDQIIHKSTPVARKSLNFNNENDDDPEQTLCPTSNMIAKTTQEKEFMSKAFEKSLTTPTARPLRTRNMVSKANRKYCLAGSCLTAAEISNIKILCAQRKWTYVDKYTTDITHLVVGVDEENKSQRSVKYMCALAASKWIVSFDWINNCLQSKEILDEDNFEALDSTGEPGPMRSRIAKKKLFQGIKFYCMPPFSVLDVDTLKDMLVASGGVVVKDMKEVRVAADSCEPALLLAEPEHTQEDRFIYLAMEQSVVPVNYEWVLNCLGSYALGSVHELLLCPAALLPAAAAAWPAALLAQDYD